MAIKRNHLRKLECHELMVKTKSKSSAVSSTKRTMGSEVNFRFPYPTGEADVSLEFVTLNFFQMLRTTSDDMR